MLSPRQMQVAELVVRGHSDKGIANSLNLSVRTVNEYIQRISVRIGGVGNPRARIFRWWYSEEREVA